MFDGADFPVEPADSVVSGLRQARDLVARPNGWCQFSMRSPRREGGESYCMSGAVHEVAKTRDDAIGMCGYLTKALGFGLEVAQWNDFPTRKQAEVVAVFDRAIARASRRIDVIPHSFRETVNV